jgi:putative ABC transport system ATP-binding protein
MTTAEDPQPSNTEPAFQIELRRLEKSYGQGRVRRSVLNGLDFQAQAGQTVALLGRSGSGKSTLLNLLAGIDQPDAGEVLVNGRHQSHLTDSERTDFRRRQVGFIYQSFLLIPTLTAFENIALVLELNGVRGGELKRRTATMLDDIGLSDRGGSYPDQLSGGEQQRIAIARALVHRPKLVLADEPTGNLDEDSGRSMLALMHSLVSQQHGLLVMVTHSLAVARSAERVLTLEQGKLSEREGEFAW